MVYGVGDELYFREDVCVTGQSSTTHRLVGLQITDFHWYYNYIMKREEAPNPTHPLD